MHGLGWLFVGSLALAMPGAAQDLTKVEPENAKVELENEDVRIVRVKLRPHVKGVVHEHVLPYVAVYLKDGVIRHYFPDGRTEEHQRKAGTFRWVPLPVKHIHENVGDEPTEVLLVEIKRPSAGAPAR